ncbi:GNAT family N-acetyltransferase [Actinomadura sp. DC4]|uniref:GNAT family N-acetyltransferase n=1 Tax=Actinomadura sp. DC4 TaxID=3055069 RepID=UPI0025B16E9E|nr:GNAT family N-acetyltransferase [Actinomadura sp. DC4]MDN3352912.1 GNAT family N-acetyltransferase [Actinomadura sp. DC4]
MDRLLGKFQAPLGEPRSPSCVPRPLHRTSIVAEDDAELTGFLVGFLSPSAEDAAYIHFVGVAPRFRGSGLGRQLYQRFFDMAQAGSRSTVRAITADRREWVERTQSAVETWTSRSPPRPLAVRRGRAVVRRRPTRVIVSGAA